MKLAHRMIKRFCGILSMSSKMGFPQHSTEDNHEDNTGVRISFRKTTDPSDPDDVVIVTVATSFWLPLPSQILFNFFKDPAKRVQVRTFTSLAVFYYFI